MARRRVRALSYRPPFYLVRIVFPVLGGAVIAGLTALLMRYVG